MTRKEQIEKQIEKLKEAKFENQMVDHWSDYNYQRDTELRQLIRDLESKLEALGE